MGDVIEQVRRAMAIDLALGVPEAARHMVRVESPDPGTVVWVAWFPEEPHPAVVDALRQWVEANAHPALAVELRVEVSPNPPPAPPPWRQSVSQ